MVGICEAESKFLCRIRKNKEGEIIGFEFVFRISLPFFLNTTPSEWVLLTSTVKK